MSLPTLRQQAGHHNVFLYSPAQIRTSVTQRKYDCAKHSLGSRGALAPIFSSLLKNDSFIFPPSGRVNKRFYNLVDGGWNRHPTQTQHFNYYWFQIEGMEM